MNRTFVVFICTQILSLIGSRMTGVAIGIQVFAETGDTAPLLIAAFFAELPQMVAGTFTGLLADRWDRRLVIIIGDVGQALGTLLLLLSFVSGDFQLWHLYLAMLIQGIFASIQEPASEATITQLVPAPQRDRANGIRQVGFPLAGIVAPVLAGFVYAIGGLVVVIAIDFLTFVASVIVVARLSIPKTQRPTEEEDAASEPFWRELAGGWLFLMQRRALFALVIYISLVFFLINGPLEMAIPYMLTRVGGDEAILGVLLGAMSAGAFFGGLLLTVMGEIKQRIRVMLIGYLLHGALLIAYGIAQQPIYLGLSIFFAMLPLPFNGALFSTFLQNKTPHHIQGRVFAVTGQLFTLTTPFSFLITAFLVDNILEPAVTTAAWQPIAPLVGDTEGAGMGLVLVSVGAIIVIATLFMLFWKPIRSLEDDMPNVELMVEAAPAN